MLAKIFSAAIQGIEALPLEVEINIAERSEFKVALVGLPDTAVRESIDRVFTALINSGFRLPKHRTTINLAPADIRKEGPSFDLAIALGILAATEQLVSDQLADFYVVGELALTGGVRAVKGVLPIALRAKKARRRGVIVPFENAAEAAVVQGLEVYGVENLRQAADFLAGKIELSPKQMDLKKIFATHANYEVDFADVKGQEHAKRALEIAAAGGHNILMIGPPGAGKSMLAKRLPTILPPLSLDEALETTKVHSIAGILPSGTGLIATRPFRAPHHTVSDIGLLGGTSNPQPGEVSLAHHGIIFLDELPEFRRNALEVLRQPLEDGTATISRAAGVATFPCEFMLVAAMNPCPCGFFGDAKRECRCGPRSVQNYRARVSGPLLDRIDIHIEVPALKERDLLRDGSGDSSEKIRARVERARELQRHRFEGRRKIFCNARMGPKELKQFCAIANDSLEMLRSAMSQLNFSARAYDRILKVARTIADLATSERIQSEHLSEAVQYRTLDRQLWV